MRRLLLTITLACAGLAACGSPAAAPVTADDLQLTGSVESTALGWQGVVSFGSARPTRVDVAGLCLPALLLYRDSAASTPAWDQHSWFNTRVGGCKWMPETVWSPGRITTPSVSTAEILGDSLPAGRYVAKIKVIFAHWVPIGAGSSTTVIDDIRRVPAGALDLTP